MFRRSTEKCITVTFPIGKVVIRIGEVKSLKNKSYKNGEDVTKNVFYILKFIDSARFVASSLSNLPKYLSEGIHRIKCNYGDSDKKI